MVDLLQMSSLMRQTAEPVSTNIDIGCPPTSPCTVRVEFTAATRGLLDLALGWGLTCRLLGQLRLMCPLPPQFQQTAPLALVLLVAVGCLVDRSRATSSVSCCTCSFSSLSCLSSPAPLCIKAFALRESSTRPCTAKLSDFCFSLSKRFWEASTLSRWMAISSATSILAGFSFISEQMETALLARTDF